MRAILLSFLVMFFSVLPLTAQVIDDWSPYIDSLNDLTAETVSKFSDARGAMAKLELVAKADTSADAYASEIAVVKGFVATLERVKTYLDSIDRDLYAWNEKYNEYTAEQQQRIDEVNALVNRLSVLYDGYNRDAVDLLRRIEGIDVTAESPYWKFGFNGEIMAAYGEAYGTGQNLGDYSLNFVWERSDGLLLEVGERASNEHRNTNTRTQTTSARQRFDFDRGYIQLKEYYKDVDGLDNTRNTREEWRVDFDFSKDYGKRGSYFRVDASHEDRSYTNAAASSFTYNNIFGLVHHELNDRHSAEGEFDYYEYNFGVGGVLSQETFRYRLGWETAFPNGVVLNADYLATDKDFPDSQVFSYTENALRLGARYDHSDRLRFDLRFSTLTNDRNEIVPQGQVETGANDYDENSFEARIYTAPREDLNVNIRGFYRDKSYVITSPFDLKHGAISLYSDYHASNRLSLFAEGKYDQYNYGSDVMSFDRSVIRTGMTYSFPGASSVGAEYSFTEQTFDNNGTRDYTIGEFLASYNKYWKNFRLRATGGLNQLSQHDPQSTNIYSGSRFSCELTWYANPNMRFSIGSDVLDRNYDNQADVTDWLTYVRLAFNF